MGRQAVCKKKVEPGKVGRQAGSSLHAGITEAKGSGGVRW